jgi:hypothetical protein
MPLSTPTQTIQQESNTRMTPHVDSNVLVFGSQGKLGQQLNAIS